MPLSRRSFVKSYVGRLRPDFLARCQYDEIARACTGTLELVDEGRRSFPSGAYERCPRRLTRQGTRRQPSAAAYSSSYSWPVGVVPSLAMRRIRPTSSSQRSCVRRSLCARSSCRRTVRPAPAVRLTWQSPYRALRTIGIIRRTSSCVRDFTLLAHCLGRLASRHDLRDRWLPALLPVAVLERQLRDHGGTAGALRLRTARHRATGAR